MHCVCDVCVCSKVDPGNTGRVGPTEAALFLKKSGLPDITLGKVGSGKSYSLFWCCFFDGVSVTSHRAGEVCLFQRTVDCSLWILRLCQRC